MQTMHSHSARCRIRFMDLPAHAGRNSTPCLFIHGLGCAASYEYPRIAASPALAGRRTILLDLAGHGYSERPQDFSYSTSAQAAIVSELANHLNLPHFYLYGHSMGGSIAIEAAEQLGSRVRGLMVSECNLIAGGGIFSRNITAQDEAYFIHNGYAELLNNELSPWAGSLQSAAPWALWRSAYHLVNGISPDWLYRLSSLPQRKIYLVGDRSLPNTDYDLILQYGIPCAVIADAGHSMSWENPEGLATALAEFMYA